MEEERDWITDRLADREGLGHTSGTIAEATRNRSDEAPHLSSKSLTHDIHSSQSEVRESTGACTFSEGTVLAGRYVLMKHVAGGGTCDVYRARDLMAVQRGAAEQSYVAIKLLKPALVARLGSADAVLDEALITRHLSHPNIIKVFDYYVESCEEGDRHFVAMEWVEGETLSERLDRMPHRIMPYSQVLRVFEDIASALSAAHAVGIIHADLKPSNILIGLDGRVKVIDFATARGARVARWRQGGSSREMAALEARRGFFAYTEGYASDAIKNDEAVTVQDDVYAFATMLYEALSGRAPNERQSNNWPKPRSVRYTQWPVLSRVLKPKARKRWSDVEAFFRAFTRARHQDRVIALLFLGGLIAGLAVWQGARSAIQFQAYMETLAQSDRNMITATDMADHISNAPVKALPVVLGEVRVLPELLSAGVLRVTSPGVFSRLEQYVDEALSEKAVNDFEKKGDIIHGDLSSEHVDFDDLEQLVAKVKPYFPQSHRAYILQTRIAAAKSAYQTALLNQWRVIWENGQYDDVSGQRLIELQNRLKTMAPDVDLAPSLAAQKAYRATVRRAAFRQDNESLAQLLEFEERFTQQSSFDAMWLQQAWKGLGVARKTGLKVLEQKRVQQSEGENQATAINLPIAQRIKIEKENVIRDELDRLEKLWLDRDLLIAEGEAAKRLARVSLTLNDAVAQPIVEKMMERISQKIAHYRKKDPKLLTTSLEKALASLERYRP